MNVLIGQSIDYIENHLTHPATVEEIAAAAGYSRHHFSRIFLTATGLTPNSYLRKRRLSEAARELVTTPRRILDIALDYQFGSQEAFTRSFRREFGINPGLYRQKGRLHRLWEAVSLGLNNLLYPGQGISPAPQLIIPEARIVEGLVNISPHSAQRGARWKIDSHTHELTSPVPSAVTIRNANRQDIGALCQLYYDLH